MAGKVLAAVDFGDPSLEALRQARSLAHGLGSSLAVCHVLPAPSLLSEVLGAREQAELAELTGQEEDAKRAILELARERLGLELSEVIVRRGEAHEEIARTAEAIEASYVVVGTHGKAGLARVVLGSVAERTVRHAHCSVLVARPVTRTGIVIAATDLSESSLPVIAEGAAAAERSGARLVVLSVLEWGTALPMPAVGMFGALPAMPPPELQQEVRDALKSTVEQAMARVGVKGEARVAEGTPAEAIVASANDLGAELVVMGTHGRTALARLALGSVAESVIRRASAPVLVVRY